MTFRLLPKSGSGLAMRSLVALTAAISAPIGAQPVTTPSATSVTKPVPAVLPLAVQFEIKSANTGRTYKIYLAKPVVPAPADGYGVLYVLDGDPVFATAASQALLASMLEGRRPIMVVGIGYPDILAATQLRTRDLTPYLPIAGTDVEGPVKPEDWGGADAFHKFMIEELRPVVESMAGVNKSDQSLMGYSLGGLFALHVLLSSPKSYNVYVIGSPAIFYTGKKVLEDLPAFARKVGNGEVSPRILITSAALEQSEARGSLPPIYKMIDNARDVAERLKAIAGRNGYSVDYTLFAGETHNSGIPASTSRGVAFVESAGEGAGK